MTPWFPDGQVAQTRHAVVIGAGIAGASVARSLAERGFTVEVLERHALVAQEASGNPAGIVLPVLSRTGNALSQLTQLGMRHAQQRMSALMQQDARVDWQSSGVLRLARNPRHAAQQELIAAQADFPPDFARWVDAAEGSALVGCRWSSQAGGLRVVVRCVLPPWYMHFCSTRVFVCAPGSRWR